MLALGTAAPPSAAVALDARCEAPDRAITQHIKALIEQADMRSTTRTYAAVQRLTSARMEYNQARVDSALKIYHELQSGLGVAASTQSAQKQQ